MDFISNRQPQNKEIYQALGIDSIEQLLQDIPAQLRLPSPPTDDGISEYEGLRLMESLAQKNTFPTLNNYLGAGAYEHHVPALVGAICSKSEFLTSYTPYQAEASQGMLQATFEFQSAICALTGMEVANASLYDGASACAEAVLMALRIQKSRSKVLVAESLHPHYRAVVDQYLKNHAVAETIPVKSDARLDMQSLENLLDANTAAVLVSYPTFFGTIEDMKSLAALVHAQGALLIVCANPLVYGLYASAGEIGADIAAGDCQPLGIPLQFGGPYAGYLATRQSMVRQLPGRLVGETVDSDGRRAFVLTLQAREQHIRREKATSNICTNQALAALAALITMLWYGKRGMHQWALTNYQRAAYLRNELGKLEGVKILSQGPFFNEFAVKFPKPLSLIIPSFYKEGIAPGIDLGRFYPQFAGYLLIAVTETKTQKQLDRFIEVAKTISISAYENDF